jgi:adenosylcobinamide-phosphate synthase
MPWQAWFTWPGAMLVALALDRAFGEPPARWHPVVGMGGYLGWAGRGLPALAPAAAFAAGTLAWAAGALASVGVAWVLQAGLQRLGTTAGPAGWIAATVLLGLLLKPMLAWRMLRDEVQGVETALAAGLDEGRARIARLASRDTHALDATQVRETAIETLAENLNDSVVAPLFWFAVAGLPGAVLYRYANTADAMWGYRGRWEWAGKWAARADDVLSWLPARLTALALLPAPSRWPALAREARRTASPNGGWPMGAMALALQVRLGKPGVYVLGARHRATAAGDVPQALRHAALALRRAAPGLLALAALGAWAW